MGLPMAFIKAASQTTSQTTGQKADQKIGKPMAKLPSSSRHGGSAWFAAVWWLAGFVGACLWGAWYLEQAGVGWSTRLTLISGLLVAMAWMVLVGWFLYRRTLRQALLVISEVHAASERMALSSGQMASASASVAQGANHQAASLQATSSSLEQLLTMVQHNDNTARQADKLTGEVTRAVDATRQAMEKLLAAVERIKASSRDMAGITDHIQEIAAQTGLLSINAALEATRAGEYGRGFSVVAREVGELAKVTRERALGIAKQVQIAQVSASSGAALAGEVNELLRGAVAQVNQITQLIGDITRASQEQARGMGQIADAVNSMDTVTQSAASSAEESATGASQLSSLTVQMRTSLDSALRELSGIRRAAVSLPSTAAPKPTSPKEKLSGKVDRFWAEELDRLAATKASSASGVQQAVAGVQQAVASASPGTSARKVKKEPVSTGQPASGVPVATATDSDDDFVAFN